MAESELFLPYLADKYDERAKAGVKIPVLPVKKKPEEHMDLVNREEGASLLTELTK